jgi:predicted PurR-regulated permease PerM
MLCLDRTVADSMSSLCGWVRFAGVVLVVAVLYWAQAIFVPIALAILFTFVLTPPVVWLQRRIGRIAAVLSVVILVFTVLALAGYGVYRQMESLGNALPTYRANIRTKVHDVRGVGSGGSVKKLEESIEQLKGDLQTPTASPGTPARPVVVTTEQVPGVSAVAWLGPIMEPLSTAGFVITLVLFMLLEREHLRDRLLGLFGHGHLAVTTKAMEEASRRVSRQLLLQTVVNVIYGVLSVIGLHLLGVPFPLFWGAVGAALRFVPYVGPIAAAAGPILLGLAALPGWTRPLEVAGFYVALELFTNLVLETALYAGALGVSPVALLIAVAFWTWLWGPLGLLIATPMTVVVVVIGKHVPSLEILATLLSDAPALSADTSYYQRLLARDQAEAAELVERFVAAEPEHSVYDALLVPALNYAERDRLEGRLSPDEEAAVVETTSELLETFGEPREAAAAAASARLGVLAYATNGAPDELALRMLAQLLRDLPIGIEITSTRLLISDLVTRVQAGDYGALCIADLPPSAPSKTRYLVKKIRAALPELHIVVGRWAPPEFTDDSSQALLDAGASHVGSSLLETRKYLAELAHIGTAPPERADSDAA